MRCFATLLFSNFWRYNIARLLGASSGATGAIEKRLPIALVRFNDEKQNDAAKYHNCI
jgi:hypothetical protein